jgi:hypothetical protein
VVDAPPEQSAPTETGAPPAPSAALRAEEIDFLLRWLEDRRARLLAD